MMQSFLFKLGLLIIAMGVSFWAMASHRSKDPITAVTDEPPVDAFPRAPDLPRQAPRVQEFVGETREIPQKRQLLDLNRASAGELEALPGIGAALAQRVIAFRKTTGGFRTVADLRQVKGIGPKKFDRLKALVTVSTSGSPGGKQRQR